MAGTALCRPSAHGAVQEQTVPKHSVVPARRASPAAHSAQSPSVAGRSPTRGGTACPTSWADTRRFPAPASPPAPVAAPAPAPPAPLAAWPDSAPAALAAASTPHPALPHAPLLPPPSRVGPDAAASPSVRLTRRSWLPRCVRCPRTSRLQMGGCGGGKGGQVRERGA